MEQKEIERGNRLIAEFLDGRFHKAKHAVHSFRTLPKLMPKAEYSKALKDGIYCEGHLQYHSSWDWLMPVVEKLAKDYNISIRWYDGDCIATATNTSIEETEIADTGNYKPAISNVWQTVVKAIKHHNSQPTKNHSDGTT